MVVNRTDEMTNEHDMIRTNRPAFELHVCFAGGSISLSIIAAYTSGHQILPRFVSAMSARNNVIDSQGYIRPAAILTLVTVAAKDVFAGQNDLLEGNADVY